MPTPTGTSTLFVALDRDLAARYGIPLTQPAEVIGLTFRGRRLLRFRTPDGERDVRLTFDERRMEGLSQLTNLPLWTAAGEKIPLASLAGFRGGGQSLAAGQEAEPGPSFQGINP